MGKKDIFRTTLFGGYQREDVLDYVRSLENEKETVRILANKEKSSLQVELEKEKEVNEGLKSALDADKDRLKKLEEDLKREQEAQKDLTRLQEKVKNLEQEYTETAGEKEELYNRMREAMVQLEELQKTNLGLMERCREMEKEREELARRIEDGSRETDSAEAEAETAAEPCGDAPPAAEACIPAPAEAESEAAVLEVTEKMETDAEAFTEQQEEKAVLPEAAAPVSRPSGARSVPVKEKEPSVRSAQGKRKGLLGEFVSAFRSALTGSDVTGKKNVPAEKKVQPTVEVVVRKAPAVPEEERGGELTVRAEEAKETTEKQSGAPVRKKGLYNDRLEDMKDRIDETQDRIQKMLDELQADIGGMSAG